MGLDLDWSVLVVFGLMGFIFVLLLIGEPVYAAYKKWTIKRAFKIRDSKDRARRKASRMPTARR